MQSFIKLICLAILFLAGCSPNMASLASATPTYLPPTATRTSTAIPPTATPTPTLLPTSTPYPEVQPQLALGDNHSCLLHPSGEVSCWGWNQFGQAGQPIENVSVEEKMIPELRGIISVSAGAYHTCALDWDGRIWCWGRNNVGQLGDNTHQDSSSPILVQPQKPTRFIALSSGSLHNCAIEQSGSLFCWGSNRDGKLGYDASQPFSLIPIKVNALLTKAHLVSAGSSHTCIVDTDENLWCWGDGSFGQIGLTPFGSSSTPVKITTFPQGVINLQAGWFHTCVLLADGAVNCWGKNQDGELGNAALISRADLVSPVTMDKEVTLLAVGGQTSCVLGKNQQVSCWGRNHHGQVGDQTLLNRLLPTQISLPDIPLEIKVGGSHACIRTVANTIFCWGANDLNQLGAYSFQPSLELTPTPTKSP